MKLANKLWLATLLLIFVSCQPRQGREDVTAEIPDFFNRLEGTWKMDQGMIFEEWTRSGETFKGKVYQKTGKQTRLNESFVLRTSQDTIYFRVTVLRQNEGKPIDFIMTQWDAHEVVFENPDHDFPNTIAYTLLDDDHLETRVSGLIQDSQRTITHRYTRN